jgi:hypothetical protein
MKASEFKLSIVQGINNLIDDYFGSNTMGDRFINSTLKIMVRQNTYKLDNIVELFTDESGWVDEEVIIEEYSKVLGESGFIFDLRDMIKNEMIRSMLPNRALIIKSEDLRKMFCKPHG